MSTYHEDTSIPNMKKGKRMTQSCDLKGQDDIILNARKKSKANKCLHPKHTFYLSTTQNGMKGRKFKKALE
ncbi:9051_t:CDS:2 [Funneliformis geosporum]|nr:9051_t:CDS:2 [Funneliformis geosporum]